MGFFMVDVNKFAEEDAAGYNITIVGRNALVTEAMKNYFWDKLSKVERFHNHIMHVFVTMDIQRVEQTVTIILKFDHFEVKVHATTTDMYASIDKAIDRLVVKLRRWKEKIQDHHKKGMVPKEMRVDILERPYLEEEEFNEEIEAARKEAAFFAPKIIGNDSLPLKTLTGDEAIMKMELSDHPFMIFRDEVDMLLKVIYKRPDGNYGIVQPDL